jgi:hypothetical protein
VRLKRSDNHQRTSHLKEGNDACAQPRHFEHDPRQEN